MPVYTHFYAHIMCKYAPLQICAFANMRLCTYAPLHIRADKIYEFLIAADSAAAASDSAALKHFSNFS